MLKLVKYKISLIFYVRACFACMYVCIPHALWRADKDVRIPETGVTDGCKPPWGCWELNPGPL